MDKEKKVIKIRLFVVIAILSIMLLLIVLTIILGIGLTKRNEITERKNYCTKRR